MTEAAYLVESYGMSRRVADAIATLRSLWPYHDGPAHIVLADFNLEHHFIEGCIEGIANGETCSSEGYEAGHPVYAATAAVLREMLAIPEEELVGWYANA